jgi:hypothetical protein
MNIFKESSIEKETISPTLPPVIGVGFGDVVDPVPEQFLRNNYPCGIDPTPRCRTYLQMNTQ